MPRINKVTLFALIFALVGIGAGQIALSPHVSALSGSNFNPGNIIDDATFTNINSMSVSGIQSFLNSKVSCDTNGTLSKSYYYNSGTGYVGGSSTSGSSWVTTSRAVYGQRYDAYYNTGKAAAPYVCLPQYVENPLNQQNNLQNPNASISGGQSAAQIIYNAAQQYQINPEVLIVTLQKEQGLVTDDWPWTNEYQIAMGYACPDTAPCNSQYYGFANQVSNSAYQYRRYLNNPNSYNYVVGSNYIAWNPSSACGGSTVNIQNQATAGLYDYTPYQPNAAALQNVSDSNSGGSGDSCSAYGNRNFWWYFNEWFGPSAAQAAIVNRYNQLGGSTGSLGAATNTLTCGLTNDGCYQNYQNGAIVWSNASGAWESRGSIRDRWSQLGYQAGVLGYPTGPETYDGTGWWQQYQGGAIIGTGNTGYWASKGDIRIRWGALGYQTGVLGYPTGPEISNGNSWWQQYQNGYIVGTGSTGYWESLNGPIRDRWAALGYQTGVLGYPVASVSSGTDGSKWQQYQNGYLFQAPGATQAWESKGAIRAYWGTMGYQSGALGYPVGPENTDNTSWWQQYQNGYIVGNGKTGYWESLNGPIRDRWAALGYQTGSLGYATAATATGSDGSKWQQYQNGYIIQAPGATSAWESKGAIRLYWAQLGYQTGQAGYPIGGEAFNSSTQTWSQQYQNGTIYHGNNGSNSFVPNP